MPIADALWSVATLLLGFVIGKFLALASLRMPAGQPVDWSNSACEACRRRANVADLLPVAGYVMLRGRCPACATAMPVRFPLIEGACLAIAIWAIATFSGPLALLTALLGWWLLLIAIVDAEHFWLPDRLTIPLAVFGLVAAAAYGPQRLIDHAIGASAGFVILTAIAWVYEKLRGRQGMGGGDARLLAAAGAWAGWIGLPSVVLWASATALVVVAVKATIQRRVRGDDRVPFGTYLAFGIWLTWLYGPLGRDLPI